MLEGDDSNNRPMVDASQKGAIQPQLGKGFGKLSKRQLGFPNDNSVPGDEDAIGAAVVPGTRVFKSNPLLRQKIAAERREFLMNSALELDPLKRFPFELRVCRERPGRAQMR